MFPKVTDPSQLLRSLSPPLCLLAIEYVVSGTSDVFAILHTNGKNQITTLLYNITINYIPTIVGLLT